MIKNRNKIQLRTIILFSILFIFSANTIAAVTYNGSIYLHNGKVYENVEYKVDSRYKTLSFEFKGEKVHVSFSQVHKIVSDNGNDVTKSVLKDYYKDSGDTQPAETEMATSPNKSDWHSEESTTYKKAHEKFYSGGFIFSGTYSIPSGHYYSGLDGGVGFSADLLIPVSKSMSVRFAVHKPKISYYSFSTSTLGFFVSAQYNKQLKQEELDASMVYFYSGLGVVDDKLMSHFALTAGGGFIKMLSPSLGLNTELGLDLPGAYDEEVQALIIEIRFGLMIEL